MIAYYRGPSGLIYSGPVEGARPVLVLDPDNAKDMAAFGKAYHQALKFPFDPTEALTAAVRSLLPKPIPTDPGMAARVTAGGWQRARDADGCWWALGSNDEPGLRWNALYARYPDLVIEGGDES